MSRVFLFDFRKEPKGRKEYKPLKEVKEHTLFHDQEKCCFFCGKQLEKETAVVSCIKPPEKVIHLDSNNYCMVCELCKVDEFNDIRVVTNKKTIKKCLKQKDRLFYVRRRLYNKKNLTHKQVKKYQRREHLNEIYSNFKSIYLKEYKL